MALLVTGAAGFVGTAVTRELARQRSDEPIVLADKLLPPCPSDPRFKAVAVDLLDEDALHQVMQGIDSVLHLISLPGGSAEADPVLSRRLNVDLTLRLAERLAKSGAKKSRMVFASSIAVFGELGDRVDDDTRRSPLLTYGAHKWMAEIGLADFARRGEVETLSLRLPGIIARPRGNAGLKSAFFSDVFSAARDGEKFIFPVSAQATAWLMSVERVAKNLMHALDLSALPGNAVTLPALRVAVGDLAAALYPDTKNFDFAPDESLERIFGRFPPLSTDFADALGFTHDGNLEELICASWRSLDPV